MKNTLNEFNIGDRVRYIADKTIVGEVIGYTTLGEVVGGDCEDDETNEPWCIIKWDVSNDHCQNFQGDPYEGAEAEFMLEKE